MKTPKGWNIGVFGSLFDFKNGVNSDKNSYGTGVSFINVMEIIYNNCITPDIVKGSVQITEKQMDVYSVLEGDVLFNRTSEIPKEIGLTAVYKGIGDMVFGGFVIRGRSKTSKIDNEFKKYCFDSDFVRKQIIRSGQGAIRSNIGQGDLEKITILLPPLSEQQEIAAILSKWDELIEQQTQLITAKEKRKKGLMQKLLTGEIRFPGFSGEWESVELGEVCDYEQPTKYIVKSTAYSDLYELPVLTAGKTFILGYTNETEGVFEGNLPVIIFDDFTTANKFVDFRFKVKSSAMKILRVKSNDANIKFLFEIIQILRFVPTDHKRYWISEYSQIVIDLPSIEEQNKLADFANSLDIEIKSLKDELVAMQQQKKGLMQQLLTGKIRVKV